MKTVRQSLLTICIAVATMCAGTVNADADEDVRLVTLVQDADYAPFMTAEEAGPAGIYAEIIKEADKRLPGYTIELTSAPWTRAKFLVQSGKVNGLVGTYRKPIRRPWIRHFSTPMATETIYVYCREGVAQDHWEYPKDYAGLLFSNNAGFSTPGTEFFEMVLKGKIQLIEEQTTDANLRLLQLGRADCYVQQQEAVEISIQSNNFDKIKPIREVHTETAHIGYSQHWSAEDGDTFIADMDNVLKQMTADGTIRKIIMNWTDGTI
ncbi:substrate-binding periplasmic protein [Roseibium sp. MB-4]